MGYKVLNGIEKVDKLMNGQRNEWVEVTALTCQHGIFD